MQSLEHIKAGDEIAVPLGISGDNYSIVRVERVTATQIITPHQKWRRSDGRLIGSSGWSTNWAVPVTDRIREKVYRRELVRYLSGIDWTRPSTRALELVRTALESAQADDAVARAVTDDSQADHAR